MESNCISSTLVPTVANVTSWQRCTSDSLRNKNEDTKGTQRKSKKEPLRSMIQGLPGAGKTMVITLLVEYTSNQYLDGHMGHEAQCIASMNTMAALIGGSTIRGFGEVPIGEEHASAKKT